MRMLIPSLPVLAALATVIMTTAACGGPAAGGQASAGSCGGNGSGYLASAKVAFIGDMLPGAHDDSGLLTSPAKVRVVRYLKGHGPAVVTVETGVTTNDDGTAVNAEGVQAKAGERWTIYARSASMPYQTDVCSGSAQDASGH